MSSIAHLLHINGFFTQAKSEHTLAMFATRWVAHLSVCIGIGMHNLYASWSSIEDINNLDDVSSFKV
jgi:hypothetical protein